jgi:hypothetical protein
LASTGVDLGAFLGLTWAIFAILGKVC